CALTAGGKQVFPARTISAEYVIMLRILFSFVTVAAMLAVGAPPSLANDRYAERPPVVVSPDLSAPLILQLQGAPRVTTRNKTTSMHPLQVHHSRARPADVQTDSKRTTAEMMP